MSRTNPKPSELHRGTKFLLASLASAVTLSGWAWLTLTAPPPAIDTEEPDPIDTATVVPTERTTNVVSVALMTTPVPFGTPLPSLKQLPVRGLRYVGDAKPTLVPVVATGVPPGVQPPAVPQADANQPPQNNNQPKEKVNAGGAPQPPAPPAPTDPPAPKPKPTRKAKPSK